MKKLFIFLTFWLSASIFISAQSEISSKGYLNYSYNSLSNPTNSFDFDRVYLTYKNKFSDAISFKVTTDVGRFDTGKDDRLSLYLKNALVVWQTNFGKFVFGLQGMNMFNVEEKNWGYRFIEKAPMDLNHFSSAADLGFGYYYNFKKKLNFSALITNGTGYKKSENDNYKKFSFQAFYGDSKLSKGGYNFGTSFSFESFDYTVAVYTSKETKTVLGVFAGYSTGALRVGAEYDYKKTSGSNVTAIIISAYANYKFSKIVEIFGRFDIFDPNSNLNKDANSYSLVGLNFIPAKGFSIAPNVKIKTPQIGNTLTTFFVNFEFEI